LVVGSTWFPGGEYFSTTPFLVLPVFASFVSAPDSP
jgi:hypothetical protein